MTEINEEVEDIYETYSEHLDITKDEVRSDIQELVNEYSVPIDEASRAVASSLRDEADIEYDDVVSSNDEILVNEIDEEGAWVDVRVKLVELWEPRSDSVSQVGLVGDESGRNKFIAFKTSELEELEEGESYLLSNVVTDEYQGDYSIKLNRTTEITKLDSEVVVGDESTTISGALVDLQSGSGLIKRFSEEGCNRSLKNGMCPVHGDVDGVNDIRIMAAFDTGKEVHTVVFNRELTESVTGYTLDEVVSKAMDTLDRDVALDMFRKEVVGRYYRVTGSEIGDLFNANSYEVGREGEDADEILIKARAL